SREATFPSAKMLLPLISLSFAVLRDFSAEPGGASSLKMLLPVNSWNFWLWIFLAVLTAGSSPNMILLGPPAGYTSKILH
ncbi:Os02g0574701, partial [Oryza sativa Japonica Group]